MATSPYPISCQVPYYSALSLATVSACTTRGPTATANLAAANIIQLTNTSTNGLRIDSIQVQACSTAIGAATVAQIVQIWMWDGTNAYLRDEITVTAQTPSATAPAFFLEKSYPASIQVPPGNKLYASTTVATTASTTALQVVAVGGAY